MYWLCADGVAGASGATLAAGAAGAQAARPNVTRLRATTTNAAEVREAAFENEMSGGVMIYQLMFTREYADRSAHGQYFQGVTIARVTNRSQTH